jgi:formylglycine-generating enzyme required for sulfatase activity
VATVEIGPSIVTLGIDDIEAEDADPAKRCDLADHIFGWDNESPSRQAEVKAFRIEWRPVTNGDFYEFYKGAGQGRVKFPASWEDCKGEPCVRTLYGPVPIKIAWDWPVLTCYENLSTYASVKGGRIPTEPELRLFLDKFSFGYEGGANVGFRNWHPVPATTGGSKYGGKGHNGGVWEWTSTIFDKYDGFVPSALYPGYSADFFDGSHQVVLGGSYATIPRISERRSVRNWYQRNYPYCWTSARIAYDV